MNAASLFLFHMRQAVHMSLYFLNRKRFNQLLRLITGRSRRAVPIAGGRWK